MQSIPILVNTVSAKVKEQTQGFVESTTGRIFLMLIFIGPLTFVPTLWEVWTAPNIDAFRTLTWPALIVVNIASLLALVHNGDWRMRLIVFIWTIIFALVFLATLVR